MKKTVLSALSLLAILSCNASSERRVAKNCVHRRSMTANAIGLFGNLIFPEDSLLWQKNVYLQSYEKGNGEIAVTGCSHDTYMWVTSLKKHKGGLIWEHW